MLENYQVYKVDGTIIGSYITLDQAKHIAQKHKGARIATKKDGSGKDWNYTAMQGRFVL